MKRLIFTTLVCITLVACGGGSDNGTSVSEHIVAKATTQELLDEIRVNRNVPAIGGLFWQDGKTIESGVAGLRAITGSQEVTNQDKWHLGSITKSMTATLAARLVEANFIDWNTRIVDVFGPEITGVNSQYLEVTLVQLLSHHGGMTENITDMPNWDVYFSNTNPVNEQRLDMVANILRYSTSQPNQFAYSNAGFIVAGAMLEQVTMQTWEQLMQAYVFYPLDIFDAGFGVPDDGFLESQPYGHTWNGGGWESYSPTHLLADNPKAFGPAGTVHMSLESLLKYLEMHVNGRAGISDFLSQTAFDTLHTAYGADYALGWFVDGENLSHMGTNTRWYAKVGWNAVDKLIAIAVTNAGGERGDAATDDVINSFLIRNKN